MRPLAKFDQFVPMERGEAFLLLRALKVLIGDLTRVTEQPVAAVVLLTTLPLVPLSAKLQRLHNRETDAAYGPRPSRKPRQLRVSCAELAALLHHRLPLYHCGLLYEENLLLQGIIGKFHQKSTSLSHLIRF